MLTEFQRLFAIFRITLLPMAGLLPLSLWLFLIHAPCGAVQPWAGTWAGLQHQATGQASYGKKTEGLTMTMSSFIRTSCSLFMTHNRPKCDRIWSIAQKRSMSVRLLHPQPLEAPVAQYHERSTAMTILCSGAAIVAVEPIRF